MQPLIDADVLVYEIGAICQYEEDDKIYPRSWNFVQKKLDEKIASICKAVGASKPPRLFLTNDSRLHKMVGKREDIGEYVPNFREEVAVTKPYKGHRKNEKPLHTDNIKAYMYYQLGAEIAYGMEADDLLAINQAEDTVICTRDKDLRQVPGWHYGWKCGKQEEFPLTKYDEFGEIEFIPSSNKIVGGGYLFYATQMVTGDTVDNIPGLPLQGPAKAYQRLKECDTITKTFITLCRYYREVMGPDWRTYFKEQHQLLYMRRE